MAKEPLRDRIQHAWDVFRAKDSNQNISTVYGTNGDPINYGLSSYRRTDRTRLHQSTEKSLVAAFYNRIALDVASVSIRHVRTNENGKYIETINSGLNECLTVEANIDQTGRELIFDAVLSMFDEGVSAIVPVDTSVDLLKSNSFDILSLRVGKITQWYPRHVQVELYDQNDGKRKSIQLPKDKIAIVENPFYEIMNEPNSTLKRLIAKMNQLDYIDSQIGSGKLDMIIQLPYAIKSPTRLKEANERRQQIADQLENSKYGIAYIDGTEKVTQLNRSLDNNILGEIEKLSADLYNQLGITQSVFDGTADEKTMLNYNNRTVEPVLSALTGEMRRKFLTKTARTQGQDIMYFQDSFKLVPVNELADIADKFTRNEILSSNEMRSVIGYKPVDDPKADELRNKNLNQNSQDEEPVTTGDIRVSDIRVSDLRNEDESY